MYHTNLVPKIVTRHKLNWRLIFLMLRTLRFDGCPRKVVSETTCRPNTVEKIYDGMNNATFDYGLEPFTGMSLILFRTTIMM